MEQLLSVIRHIHRDAVTFGTSGNVSARAWHRGDSFWITPSGLAWDAIGTEQLVEIAVRDGRVVQGGLAPSTEWRFHQTLYRQHPWIQGIVHLHSQYATILSTLDIPVLPVHYQMARVADAVPVIPYQTFGTKELADAIGDAIDADTQAVLLQNHGMVAVGDSPEAAYRAAKEVEWTAMIQYHAMLIAPPRVLSADELKAVRDSFQHYGQHRPT